MSIKEQEKELFEEWKENRKPFVADGVVSEEYFKNPKIVFILKEVNDPNDDEWDLREYLRGEYDKNGDEPVAQTWNNVARWVHGIRKINSIPDWEDYPKIDVKFRKDVLKSICVMNLKKSPGIHTTNYDELKKVAEEDRVFIQRQYNIYKPDITICCGRGYLFRSVIGDGKIKWETTNRDVKWYKQKSNSIVISYFHPQARIKSSLMLYSLLDAVHEIYVKEGMGFRYRES